jgi:hypothetical protein
VLGSWDNYRTATALEQDRRVGRDVWKAILTANGGLEMGSEHFYYVRVLCGIECQAAANLKPRPVRHRPETRYS